METKNRSNSPKGKPHIWADRFSGGRIDTINADDPTEGAVAVSGCILFCLLLMLLVLAVYYLSRLFTILNENIENKVLLGAIVAAGALGVGASLYQLRKYRRGIYGLLEISFAVITIWVAMSKLSAQGDLSVWLAFGGASYLVVRGLDNLQISREETKKLKALEESKKVSLQTDEPNNSLNPTP